MRRMLVIPLLAALAIPGTARAQDEGEQPPALRLSFFMCDFNKLSAAMEEAEARDIPVWNDLIAEGMVQSYGYFVHSWASEYNVGIYTIGESIEAILAAVDEADRRFQERYGDEPSKFGEACPHHRDGFYTMGPSAEASEGGGGQD
ncbi:MAG: hypothetical protein JSV95_01910 [Gemmatimonadota bacterium]|nr:MAG: hypothetical protein JSV95_01910 [Gemmatimonadota bacterium]